jgi:hypothetical protein
MFLPGCLSKYARKYFLIKIKLIIFFQIVSFTCFLHKLPGDLEGLFKLAIQLRTFFYSAIYNTATGYVLWVYLTNI